MLLLMPVVAAVGNLCTVVHCYYSLSLLVSLYREESNRYAVTVLAVLLLMLAAAACTELLLLLSIVPSTAFVVPVFFVVAIAVAGAAFFSIIAVLIQIAFDGSRRGSGKVDDIMTILCSSLLSLLLELLIYVCRDLYGSRKNVAEDFFREMFVLVHPR